MTDSPPFAAQADASLAPWTTLEVGGPARWLAEVHGELDVAAALAWATSRRLPALVLGGGSNVVVSDDGFDGLVVRQVGADIRVKRGGDRVRVFASAGVTWDDLVARAVDEGLAGIECLSGIPGRVGAAPIQNIGAYGQEVGDVVVAVHAVDRAGGEPVRLSAATCRFGYRTSAFKTQWRDELVVTGVELDLFPGPAARPLAYRDLTERFGGTHTPPVAEVREAVLEIRRAKSMVLDPDDVNRRSAGSFFLNPVVDAARAVQVLEKLGSDGPCWPTPDGRMKLSAAWLIERAGLRKGDGDGPVGLSTRHALAIVNRGGATAAQILAFAARIRAAVREASGVALEPEPVLVGFDESAADLLDRLA